MATQFKVGDEVIFKSGFTPARVAAVALDGRLFLVDRHGRMTARPDRVMLLEEYLKKQKEKEVEDDEVASR